MKIFLIWYHVTYPETITLLKMIPSNYSVNSLCGPHTKKLGDP